MRMTDQEFAYRAVLDPEMSHQVSSLIAYQELNDNPLRAVIWNLRREAWTYSPEPAARFLYDDRYFDETKEVDRPTAERLAREVLHTELPSEETLQAMCDEGQRMGWTYGPPET
jgi:hypothetical protein